MTMDHMVSRFAPYVAMAVAVLITVATFAAYMH
jgi:hypothetical protein